MDSRVLVCCKSVTGFTRRYAGVIAREAGGTLMDWKDVSAKTAAPYETMVFGGRFRAGTVDGLKRAKAIARSSGAALIVFATGAMPAGAAEMVLRQTWEKNFTADELDRIPHFYMPGGLCYEKMPLLDRALMKTFAAVMKRRLKGKEELSEQDREFVRMISTSYDLFSEDFANPLIALLKKTEDGK